ncbi:MAG: DUF996 domain-containing protein, partial [Patescibacteria group bacterium]|nr:DUF996 domain-containing protein [Patescibacteria group bacterium]
KKFKNYGLIGTGLLFLGVIPYLGVILSLAGFVLLLISFHTISKISGNKKIFKYVLFSYLIGIITSILIIPLILGGLLGLNILSLSQESSEVISNFRKDLQNFYNLTTTPQNYFFYNKTNIPTSEVKEFFKPFIFAFIGFAIFIWIVGIIAISIYRKVLYMLADYTKHNLFRTTGNLYFWGLILLPLLVGIIVSIIAPIYQLLSFYELDEEKLEKNILG